MAAKGTFFKVEEADLKLTWIAGEGGNGYRYEVDGEKIPGYAKPTGVARKIYGYGLRQVLSDAYSAFSKDRDFAGAIAALESRHEGFLAGDWERRGTALGYRVEDVIAGYASLKGINVKEATAGLTKVLKETPEKIKLALTENAAFKAAVARAAADRITKAAEGKAAELTF